MVLGGADLGGGSLSALGAEGFEPSERGVRRTPPVGVVDPASAFFRSAAVSAADWEGLSEGGGTGSEGGGGRGGGTGGGGGFQTESRAGEEGPEEEGGWGGMEEGGEQLREREGEGEGIEEGLDGEERSPSRWVPSLLRGKKGFVLSKSFATCCSKSLLKRFFLGEDFLFLSGSFMCADCCFIECFGELACPFFATLV